MNLNLHLLARRLRPQLTVIDGWEVMAGDGPLHGQSFKMQFALAGTDWLAVDATAARIMGVDPENIGYLWYCAQAGLGRMEQAAIELADASSIEPYVKNLPRHTTYDQQLKWRTSQALAAFQRLQASDQLQEESAAVRHEITLNAP